MAIHKLLLEDPSEDQFSLIAIHCSEEDYKMAFKLNQALGLQLRRHRLDLDFSVEGQSLTYPLFEFYHEAKYLQYFLVGNKCSYSAATLAPAQGLFAEMTTGKTKIAYLLPEFKKVDYFMKIETDSRPVALRETISKINEIKEVISSYVIQNDTIKTNNNLIFN